MTGLAKPDNIFYAENALNPVELGHLSWQFFAAEHVGSSQVGSFF